MIVKRTMFNKEGINFNVTTRKISTGFITSAQGLEERHDENLDNALKKHKEYVEELKEVKLNDLDRQIKTAKEQINRLTKAKESLDDDLAEAQKQAEEQLKQYKEHENI